MNNSNWKPFAAIAIVVGVLFVLVLGVGLLGPLAYGGYGSGMGPGMMGPWMMGGYGAQGFGFNPLSAILSLVFWALIIAGGVLLVLWLVRGGAGRMASSGESALDILKTRYAKGEITKEQFDAMKRDLEQQTR